MRARRRLACAAAAGTVAASIVGGGTSPARATAPDAAVARLAYTAGDGSLRLATMTPQGQGISDVQVAPHLPRGSEGAPFPTVPAAWSPDGRWLLVTRQGDVDNQSAVYEVATGRLSAFRKAPAFPDVAFAVDDHGNVSSTHASPGGGIDVQLTDPAGAVLRDLPIRLGDQALRSLDGQLRIGPHDVQPVVGAGVLFTSVEDDDKVDELWLLDPATGNLREIAHGAEAYSGSVSPDGRLAGVLDMTTSGSCLARFGTTLRVVEIATGRVTAPLGTSIVSSTVQWDGDQVALPVTPCGGGLHAGVYDGKNGRLHYVGDETSGSWGPYGLTTRVIKGRPSRLHQVNGLHGPVDPEVTARGVFAGPGNPSVDLWAPVGSS